MAQKISAVLIARNEAGVISRCIKSLMGMDEIVVYDTGSTDRTREIAEEAGATVFQGERIDPFHFAQARNLAVEKASHGWILMIDADEILRAGSASKIRKAMKEVGEETAFAVTFIHRAEQADWYPVKTSRSVSIRKIKLYKKDAWTWKYRVHEQLEEISPGKVKDLSEVVIEHMPEPDKERRHGQNIELLKLCIQENPEYLKASRYLGQELMLQKKWEEALPYLYRYAEKSQDSPHDLSQVCMYIGDCLAEMDRLDEALIWFDRSSRIAPFRREPLYKGAWNLIKKARLEEALTWLGRLIQIAPASKPNSPQDLPAAWGNEPDKMIRFCRDEIARAKAAYERLKRQNA